MSVHKKKRRRDDSGGKASRHGKRRGRHKGHREHRSRQQKHSPKTSDAAEASTTTSGREQSPARAATSRKRQSPAPPSASDNTPAPVTPLTSSPEPTATMPFAKASPPVAQSLAQKSQPPTTEHVYYGSIPDSDLDQAVDKPARTDAAGPVAASPADKLPFVEMAQAESTEGNDAELPGIEALDSDSSKGSPANRATGQGPRALAVRARDATDKCAPSGDVVASSQQIECQQCGSAGLVESTRLRRWRAAALRTARMVIVLPNRYRRRRPRQDPDRLCEDCKKDQPKLSARVVMACAAVVVFFGLVVWFHLGHAPAKARSLSMCTTQGCRLHELSLDRTVDTTVKPCDDFFAFACGNWKRASGRLPRDLTLDDSGGTAATFYASCLHEPGNVSTNVQQFLHWKKSLRLAWPDTPPAGERPPHPLDVLLDLAISWNINVLFKVHVYAYATTGRSSVPTILALSLGKMDAPWQEMREERVRHNSYEEYVNDHLDLLGASVRDDPGFRELFDTETRLLRVLRAGVSGTQSWFPLRELQQVTLSPSDVVVVHSTEMLGELDTLLSDYAQKAQTLLDAIAWILIQTYLWAMAGSPRMAFRDHGSSGTNVLVHEACHQLVDSRLGLLYAAPYLVKRYTLQVRKQLEEMFLTLATTAEEKILRLRWVGDGVKAEAAHKLGSTTFDVFPIADFFDGDGRQSLYDVFTPKDESSSFLVRFIEASAVLRRFVGTDAYERVYRRRIGEGGPPLSLYEYYTNIVRVSLDALERPMFTVDGSHAMNYAGLGSYVARELTRSFDPVGSTVDSTGAHLVWWGPSASGEYKSRTSCLANATWEVDAAKPAGYHPSALSMFPHVPALETAFRAYKSASEKNRTAEGLQLAFLGQLPGDQVFFLTYCHVLCAAEEEGRDAAQACNVPLANLPEFANAFRCPVGSHMNPATKCTFFDEASDGSRG
ncbi:hypothetical protein HPB52_000468 [Rhipicephalus sanguineus]|uniref:Endothelin-converting enzyme 1 n=1 Tax=Rhipicephalus sanguineus TaxID=34632 RepID=A0A9D4PTA0_RHISA|nr:hypothetical protein HPB52_000468 [Rhipicephalus sanguineus]